MAPRILIFSIAVRADYQFFVKSIATFGLFWYTLTPKLTVYSTFMLIIFFVQTIQCIKTLILYLLCLRDYEKRNLRSMIYITKIAEFSSTALTAQSAQKLKKVQDAFEYFIALGIHNFVLNSERLADV
jgi:hypothetical protein